MEYAQRPEFSRKFTDGKLPGNVPPNIRPSHRKTLVLCFDGTGEHWELVLVGILADNVQAISFMAIRVIVIFLRYFVCLIALAVLGFIIISMLHYATLLMLSMLI